jgi:hypothetical protein
MPQDSFDQSIVAELEENGNILHMKIALSRGKKTDFQDKQIDVQYVT